MTLGEIVHLFEINLVGIESMIPQTRDKLNITEAMAIAEDWNGRR